MAITVNLVPLRRYLMFIDVGGFATLEWKMYACTRNETFAGFLYKEVCNVLSSLMICTSKNDSLSIRQVISNLIVE